MAIRQDLQIEHATIMFRNFRGEPDKFNATGKRTFVVFLDPDVAEQVALAGWNVKRLAPRDDNPEGQAYLSVECQFKYYPPTITIIKGQTMSRLDEETVGMLDWAEIDNVDLVLRPYEWTMAGKTGIKAYLKKMWVTLHESPLDQKYANWKPDASDMDVDLSGAIGFDGAPF